jgi:hypothetical protein
MENFEKNDWKQLFKILSRIRIVDDSNEKKEKRKGKRQLWIEISTIAIAIFSLIVSVAAIWIGICQNNNSDQYQRETQAYTFWQAYLEKAAENSKLANGIELIGIYPIQKIACRKSDEDFDKNVIDTFVKYAWFVANALGTAEIVYSIKKDDPDWKKTIQTTIKNHSYYIKSGCFEKTHYSNEFNKLIDETL